MYVHSQVDKEGGRCWVFWFVPRLGCSRGSLFHPWALRLAPEMLHATVDLPHSRPLAMPMAQRRAAAYPNAGADGTVTCTAAAGAPRALH